MCHKRMTCKNIILDYSVGVVIENTIITFTYVYIYIYKKLIWMVHHKLVLSKYFFHCVPILILSGVQGFTLLKHLLFILICAYLTGIFLQ
jgi:hypothetical protein